MEVIPVSSYNVCVREKEINSTFWLKKKKEKKSMNKAETE